MALTIEALAVTMICKWCVLMPGGNGFPQNFNQGYPHPNFNQNFPGNFHPNYQGNNFGGGGASGICIWLNTTGGLGKGPAATKP
jgi:hypothetical protein